MPERGSVRLYSGYQAPRRAALIPTASLVEPGSESFSFWSSSSEASDAPQPAAQKRETASGRQKNRARPMIKLLAAGWKSDVVLARSRRCASARDRARQHFSPIHLTPRRRFESTSSRVD